MKIGIPDLAKASSGQAALVVLTWVVLAMGNAWQADPNASHAETSESAEGTADWLPEAVRALEDEIWIARGSVSGYMTSRAPADILPPQSMVTAG